MNNRSNWQLVALFTPAAPGDNPQPPRAPHGAKASGATHRACLHRLLVLQCKTSRYLKTGSLERNTRQCSTTFLGLGRLSLVSLGTPTKSGTEVQLQGDPRQCWRSCHRRLHEATSAEHSLFFPCRHIHRTLSKRSFQKNPTDSVCNSRTTSAPR